MSFESLARNRVSNISLAISSAGEVLVLAIMIGILKALKSDASVENNTKAFNVLIAFSGGVWCSFPHRLLYAIANLILSMTISALCYSVVRLRKAPAGPRYTSGILSRNDWIQTDVCCSAGVFTFETNVLVPYLFLPHVSRCSYGRYRGS